ncbi:Glucokinase [Trypanosoma melophagium]|uniref:Glucokinase n=1 Tax=Trypanosoma melophagium TaxID=715481 RepID=UPI00351A2B61|nr:Glucokinase [Trypanosoma melophagium]KAH9582210.1 Glucokinase [Trypanosoma melophagium]KAH9582222.1 Glucokinase [Trypanosoma melophagium]
MDILEVTLDQLRTEIAKRSWAAPLIFIGDVGGTSARLGFARRCSNDGLCAITTRFHMKNKDIKDLLEFFRVILATVPADVLARVSAGVINVPGPVTGGTVGGPFNNLAGLARLADYPSALFPPGRSVILNDLEAGGFGVLATSDTHTFKEYFELMWEGTLWNKCEKQPAGTVLGCGRCLVLAPGTGLGSSLVNYDAMSKKYIVIPLELSSQTLPMRDDIEYIQKAAAELKLLPNYEDMVSGAGLEFHYRQAVGGRKPSIPAAQIAQLAREGDADAMKAMKLFNMYLMRVGSESSMAFVPLTIVLIGDNIVNNGFFYSNSENVKEMRREALNHPMERFGFQSRVTYLRQKKKLNLNLVGCCRCGMTLLESGQQKSKL